MPVVETYTYRDESGTPLLEKDRIEPGESGRKKDFRVYTILADGSRQVGLGETRRVLYNLPEIIAADTCHLFEGERKADLGTALGWASTTNLDGSAGKWTQEQVEVLRGKHVVIWGDNDKPGKDRVDYLVGELQDVAKSIAVVFVPRGNDIVDFVHKEGGTNEELNTLLQVARLPENAPLRRVKALVEKRGAPIAKESEKLVLGAVLSGKVPFAEIQDLSAEDFGLDRHRKIFEAILLLHEKDKPTDSCSVIQHMEETGTLDAGSISYVAEISTELPAMFSTEAHIEAILRKSRARKLLKTLTVEAEALVVGKDPEDVAMALGKRLDEAHGIKIDNTGAHVAQIFGSMDNFFSQRKPGIMSGQLPELSDMTKGLKEGELVVIGGRPANGKSVLALQLAAAAISKNNHTEIISLEVCKEETLLKMCCQLAKVSYQHIITGTLTEAMIARLGSVQKALVAKPLHIHDESNWTVGRIRARVRSMFKRGTPIRLLVIDYLQLMRTTGTRSGGRRDLELAEITRELKLICKEYKLTILLLSQLSRANERDQRPPTPADLRDSGGIESDADVVLLVHQVKETDDPNSPEREALIIIGKQRNGPEGTIKHAFCKPFAKFRSLQTEAVDYEELLIA